MHILHLAARAPRRRPPVSSTLDAMRTLTGRLCRLEPQVEDHALEMFDVLSDPAIYEFEGVPPPSVEALAAGYKRKESRLSPDGSEVWLNWVVRLHSGPATGYVQASLTPTDLAYVGYEFSSRFWRQGIATDSLKTMLVELAQAYGVTSLVALLKAKNYRSLGLLRSLGFREAAPEVAASHDHEADELVFVRALAPESGV